MKITIKSTKMQLLLLLFKLSIIATVFSFKRFKPLQRDLQLQLTIKNVVSQNNIKGFIIFNFIVEKRSFIVRQAQDVIRQATKVASVACIKYPLKNHKRYYRNISRFGAANKKYMFVHHRLTFSGDTFAIFIIDHNWLKKKASLINWLETLFMFFQSRHDVSKALVIAVVDKKSSTYKQVFVSLTNKQIYQTNILEVRRNWKSFKESFNYSVVEWNPYVKKCRRKTVRCKNIFSPDLESNLNRHQFIVQSMFDKLYKLSEVKTLKSAAMLDLFDLYPFATAVKQLNASCKFVQCTKATINSYKDFHLVRYGEFPRAPDLSSAVLNPMYVQPDYFLAPSLYEARNDSSLGSLTSCLLMVAALIFIFWAISRLHRYDTLTWEPIVVFSMIISTANPRNPVRLRETVMFLCLISVGFFVGNDLIFGMTSTTIYRREENPIESLEDIQNNNITMYLYQVRDKRQNWGSDALSKLKMVQLSLYTKTKWSVENFKNMLVHRNVCLSTVWLSRLGVDIPQRIIIDSEVCARRTYVNEVYFGCTAVVYHHNIPCFNKLKYNLMRFHENSLLSYPRLTYERHLSYVKHIGVNVNNLALQWKSKQEEESFVLELQNFWMIIVAGIILPILLLIGEWCLGVNCKFRVIRC